MLFNSYEFLLLYLPVTLLVFFSLGKHGYQTIAIGWLVFCSLFFYSWWNPAYLGLIVISILFNYTVGSLITRHIVRKQLQVARIYLWCGVVINLVVLGYYKYANFLLDSLNHFVATDWYLGDIILPLGISFFTFTQLAYLVDAYRGEVREYNILHYSLFVTYFPHLIAGPILHHKEIIPQFANPLIYRVRLQNFVIGISIFSLGLFKKVILADNLSVYATPVFEAAQSGITLTIAEAWAGAIAYTFQLYFDFSGYSDMAIGISKCLGVRLPLNFNSPYKATSIIDFWRRWHMSLSRFLRDYLYIPLGGGRYGSRRRYLNLFTTMLLGGLWHGAGWTFVVWGALHGCYLIVNHAWRSLRSRLGWQSHGGFIGSLAASACTFIAVVVGWVFFRADSFTAATSLLRSMVGGNGVALPARLQALSGTWQEWLGTQGVTFVGMFPHDLMLDWNKGLNWLLVGAMVVWLAPNTQQLLARYRPALETYPDEIRQYRQYWLRWQPTPLWAVLIAAIASAGVLGISGYSEFLYFQF